MKFWELISAFRSENDVVKVVLEKEIWHKYKTYYDNFDIIVSKQDRSILDEVIPFELAKEVCEKSKLVFYLYKNENKLLLKSSIFQSGTDFEPLNAMEVLIRFGGKYIEEVLEYGSAFVKEKEHFHTA